MVGPLDALTWGRPQAASHASRLPRAPRCPRLYPRWRIWRCGVPRRPAFLPKPHLQRPPRHLRFRPTLQDWRTTAPPRPGSPRSTGDSTPPRAEPSTGETTASRPTCPSPRRASYCTALMDGRWAAMPWAAMDAGNQSEPPRLHPLLAPIRTFHARTHCPH